MQTSGQVHNVLERCILLIEDTLSIVKSWAFIFFVEDQLYMEGEDRAPARLVESPGGGATARGFDPWDQLTCLTGVFPHK